MEASRESVDDGGCFLIAVVAFGLAMEEGGQRQATATAKAPAARPVVKAETVEEMLARLRPWIRQRSWSTARLSRRMALLPTPS
jgi:hypothetical protein